MANQSDLLEPLKDALFVTVGFGVLALQRVNVKRTEFRNQHGDELASLQAGIGQVLGRVEETLPEPARTWVHDSRAVGAAAHERLRHLLGVA